MIAALEEALKKFSPSESQLVRKIMATANSEQIAELKEKLDEFPELSIVFVQKILREHHSLS